MWIRSEDLRRVFAQTIYGVAQTQLFMRKLNYALLSSGVITITGSRALQCTQVMISASKTATVRFRWNRLIGPPSKVEVKRCPQVFAE